MMSKEDDIHRLLGFYSSGLMDKFRRLALPLECFGLNGFFYSVIRNEGSFFQIGNLPELSNFYFHNQFYKYNPFLCHPNHFSHNQYFIGMDFPDLKYQELQQQVQQKHGVGNTLVIYKKYGEDLHILMPTSTKKNLPLNTIYLNNLAALSKFGDYFVSEWRECLPKMERYMFNLGEHKGMRFHDSHLNESVSGHRSQRERFLRQIGAIREGRDIFASLTKREKECIHALLEGKTAGQIGEVLHLSNRTIESHLDRIKTKLDCSTKPELFEKLLVYKENNLL